MSKTRRFARFMFTVRPGTSPTRAYYSGFFGGAVLTYYVIAFLQELEEERQWQKRMDEYANMETEEPSPRDITYAPLMD